MKLHTIWKKVHKKGNDGIRHYERNRNENWHNYWIYIDGADKTATTKEMNATVTTTSVTQTGNEVLGTKEKKLYYFIVETSVGKLVVNVGEKTHDEIRRLTGGTSDELKAKVEEHKKQNGGK